MFCRSFACLVLTLALAGCAAEKEKQKKKDDAEKKETQSQRVAEDPAFLAFLGRLRIAVAKKDLPTITSMMTTNFGYRWDTPPVGDSVFTYWDLNESWPILGKLLREKFVLHDGYMVAPEAVATDPSGPRIPHWDADDQWQLEVRLFRAGRRHDRAVTERDPIALGLPHRAPFVFVDEVIERQPGESATCRKTFRPGEQFFRGHFPGDPMVPGVILAEALAQTAGIAGGGEGRAFRLTAIKSMKFPSAVRPQEEITLQAAKRGAVGGLWQFDVTARVGDRLAAEGVVVLSEVS